MRRRWRADAHTVWPTFAALGLSLVACALLLAVSCVQSAALPLFSVADRNGTTVLVGRAICAHEGDDKWHCVGRSYQGSPNGAIPIEAAPTAERLKHTQNALVIAPIAVIVGLVVYVASLGFLGFKKGSQGHAVTHLFAFRSTSLFSLLLVCWLAVVQWIMLIFSLISMRQAEDGEVDVRVESGFGLLIIGIVLETVASVSAGLALHCFDFSTNPNRLKTAEATAIAKALASGDGSHTAQSRAQATESGTSAPVVDGNSPAIFSGAISTSPPADSLPSPAQLAPVEHAPSPPLYQQHALAVEVANLPTGAFESPRTAPLPPEQLHSGEQVWPPPPTPEVQRQVRLESHFSDDASDGEATPSRVRRLIQPLARRSRSVRKSAGNKV